MQYGKYTLFTATKSIATTKNKKTHKIIIQIFIVILASILLAACADQTASQQLQLQPSTQIVEKTITVPPPDLKMQYRFSFDNNPALKKAYQQYLSTGKAPNIITEGFEQFAYGIGNQPVIATTPLALTVVSLEPGEKVTNVSSGDPLRWSYALAYSGQEKQRQAHIMVKPAQINISTDLVITTDKRIYSLHMTAINNGKYMHNVRFWYPQDLQEYWNNYNIEQVQKVNKEQQDVVATVPNVNLNNLNFSYSMTNGGWSSPSWKPVRIFDDGVHTYIQFPATLSSRDMPALFVLNGKDKELVNYRSKPPYFVVDKIFSNAVLISGVGNTRSTVTVTNYRY